MCLAHSRNSVSAFITTIITTTDNQENLNYVT